MGRLTWSVGDVVYLDTDVVIYSVERAEPYYSLLLPLWTAANASEVQLAGSELLLLETMVLPLRQGNIQLQTAFRNLLLHTPFQLVPISRHILVQAARVRAASTIKTPDSIHAATALSAKCTGFLTNDRGLARVAGLSVQVLDSILAE